MCFTGFAGCVTFAGSSRASCLVCNSIASTRTGVGLGARGATRVKLGPPNSGINSMRSRAAARDTTPERAGVSEISRVHGRAALSSLKFCSTTQIPYGFASLSVKRRSQFFVGLHSIVRVFRDIWTICKMFAKCAARTGRAAGFASVPSEVL